MRFISTYIHGILDYALAILLIGSPWLFAFAGSSNDPQSVPGANPQSVIPILMGTGIFLYSLFTDYELGAVRRLPMKAHLVIDALGGLFLAASPWLFGFAHEVYLPHVILGIAEIGTALFTKTAPPVYPGHKNPVR